MKLFFIEEFGKAFVPERVKLFLKKYVQRAGIYQVNYKFFGILFYVSLLFTYLIYFYNIYPILSRYPLAYLLVFSFIFWIIIQGVIIFFFVTIAYLYIDILIYKRTKQIENVLPDFLDFVSTNLKAGMSLDKALWKAVKPRFGVLSNEVKIAAKKVMTGVEVSIALKEFSNKYNSQITKRAFDLIIEGIESGSRMAELMDRIIEDIRNTNNLKQQMAASTLTYTIFISSIVLVIAPLLFALSYNLLVVLQGFATKVVSGGTTSSLLMTLSDIKVNPNDFKIFSNASIIIVGFFTSLIISMIKKGDSSESIKYMPFFIVVSLLVYNLFRLMFLSLFGGLV